MLQPSTKRPTNLRLLTTPVLGLAVLVSAGNASAAWRGDFETGDLSQWSYVLTDAGFSVVTEPVLEGGHSAKIAIDGTHLWSNGLNRVELQRKPDAGAEGSEVYFGWSLYLPEALTNDDHQIGYWESDQSYKQVMSLHARGQDLTFNTNLPGYKEHWKGTGRLTPGTWHRVVYRVFWSAAPEMGKVSLYFDNELVVDQVAARTYVDNPAFVQVGILRTTIDKTEVMLLDDAREGAALSDVMDGMPIIGTSAPSATDSSPAPTTTDTATPPTTPAATTTPPAGSATAPATKGDSDSSSCGVAHARGPRGAAWFLLAAGLLLARVRRR